MTDPRVFAMIHTAQQKNREKTRDYLVTVQLDLMIRAENMPDSDSAASVANDHLARLLAHVEESDFYFMGQRVYVARAKD